MAGCTAKQPIYNTEHSTIAHRLRVFRHVKKRPVYISKWFKHYSCLWSTVRSKTTIFEEIVDQNSLIILHAKGGPRCKPPPHTPMQLHNDNDWITLQLLNSSYGRITLCKLPSNTVSTDQKLPSVMLLVSNQRL